MYPDFYPDNKQDSQVFYPGTLRVYTLLIDVLQLPRFNLWRR